MSPAYEEALRVYRLASAQYRAACVRYRARKSTDSEFLESRRAFDAACTAFDRVEMENR